MTKKERGLYIPPKDNDDPPAIEHLRQHHLDLYWVARVLRQQWDGAWIWPQRGVIYSHHVQHRYENAAAMDRALETMHQAFILRHYDGVEVCDAPGGHLCGVPIFTFTTRNRRGRATTRYGYKPYLDINAEYSGKIEPDIVKFGVLEPRPLSEEMIEWYTERHMAHLELKRDWDK